MVMQKLSYRVLEKLIEKQATSAEIDVLLYISKFQNNHGTAEGMYYRSICDELDISYQTFYDVKNSLVEKGIIKAEKNHYLDYDITILDNDFSSPDAFKQGRYLNTNHTMFACDQFRNLTAGAKLMAMDLMKNNLSAKGSSYHCGTKKFFADFMEKLHICKRTLQNYLQMLRLLFSIGIKDRQYWITIRAFAAKRQEKQEEQRYRDNAIATAIRRNRITMVREEDKEELDKLLKIYKKNIDSVIGNFSLATIIERSLQKDNPGIDNKKWKRRLKPNLIHRLLKEDLGLSVKDLIFDR